MLTIFSMYEAVMALQEAYVSLAPCLTKPRAGMKLKHGIGQDHCDSQSSSAW